MKLSKHVPGPWRVWTNGEQISIVGKDPVEVAVITRYRNAERHKANANLIAAAPDLLGACCALLTAHGAAIGTEYGNQLLETAIAQAKDSVSAATGANKLPDIEALTKARAFLRDSEQSQGHDSGEAIEVIRELAAEIEGMSGYWTEGTANAMQRAEQVAGPLPVLSPWPCGVQSGCTHNTMVRTDSKTHAWKCAECGYIYGLSS